MVRFGIVGCGVVGLSTATLLQENYPDSEVVLVGADRILTSVSHGAAGIFRPQPSLMSGLTCCNSDERCKDCPFTRWCQGSQKYYWNLVRSQNSVSAGAFFLPVYHVYEHLPRRPPFVTTLCNGSQLVEKDEILSLGFKHDLNVGYKFVTCMVEGRNYLPYLLSNIQNNAKRPVSLCVGQSVQFKTLRDMYNWASENKIDVLVNCTGLGAATLCGDRQLIPVRGRLVRVSAPWMKFGFFGPHNTYCYPARESVVLGGFREPLPSPLDVPLRSEDTAPSSEASKNILNRIKDLWQGPLSQSPIIEEWTGLRPHRPVVRLELNWLTANGDEDAKATKGIPIVHNYGHGSMGVALSWGTAMDALNLVDQALRRGVGAQPACVLAPGLEKLVIK